MRAEAVSTRPPAVVKEAAEMGSTKKIGCAEAETRQTARVKAIKPCMGNNYTFCLSSRFSLLVVVVEVMKTLTITFMVKLLCFLFLCGKKKNY